MTVYTEAGFEPFEYYAENGKDIIGIDMKIAELIAKELDANLLVKNVGFDFILPSLNTDDYAIAAAGLSINADRLLVADFSTPYFEGGMGIIFKEGAFDHNANVAWDDIKGKTAGAQIASAGYDSSEAAGLTTKAYDNALMAALDIGGACDYVIVDYATAKAIAEGSDIGLDYGTVGSEKESYGIAVKKGDAEMLAAVNKVIDKLIADGTVYDWYDEYTAA